MIIGLIGRARHGKDTTADILSELVPCDRYAFADPVKAAVHAALPHIDFSQYGKDEIIPELGKSPRQLYQTLGTEWGRGLVHQDIWIMPLAHYADAAERQCRHLLVTDVRFPNEVAEVLRLGGMLVKVCAEKRVGRATVNAHSSEDYIDALRYSWRINNDGTLDELKNSVIRMAEIYGFID